MIRVRSLPTLWMRSVWFYILKSLNLRQGVNVIFARPAPVSSSTIKTVEVWKNGWRYYTPMTLSVSAVWSRPGEARQTDIGFTGGGKGTHQVISLVCHGIVFKTKTS